MGGVWILGDQYVRSRPRYGLHNFLTIGQIAAHHRQRQKNKNNKIFNLSKHMKVFVSFLSLFSFPRGFRCARVEKPLKSCLLKVHDGVAVGVSDGWGSGVWVGVALG